MSDTKKDTENFDRSATCPCYCSVCLRKGEHHRLAEFENLEKIDGELIHLYLWKNTTLRELVDLLKNASALARTPNVTFSFKTIFEIRGRKNEKQLGEADFNKQSFDDNKTIADLGFVPGNIIDVALIVKERYTRPMNFPTTRFPLKERRAFDGRRDEYRNSFRVEDRRDSRRDERRSDLRIDSRESRREERGREARDERRDAHDSRNERRRSRSEGRERSPHHSSRRESARRR